MHPMLTVGLIAEHIEPHTVDTLLYNDEGEPKMSPDTADMMHRVGNLVAIFGLHCTVAYTYGHWYCLQSHWWWFFAICIGVCHELVKRARIKVDKWHHNK